MQILKKKIRLSLELRSGWINPLTGSYRVTLLVEDCAGSKPRYFTLYIG